jgi:hypothetical protein
LLLESTLDGAAKAARKLAKPTPPAKPKPTDEEPDVEPDMEAEADLDPEPTKTVTASRAKPKTSADTKALYTEYYRAIGPIVRLIDRIANAVGARHSESHKTVKEHLEHATQEMKAWMGVKS